jgi:hypothetical protein
VVVSLSALGLVATSTTPAFADHSLNGYHWTRPTGDDRKIEVKIYRLQYEGRLRDAIHEWGRRTEFSFSISDVDSNCKIPTDAGRLKVCDDNYGNTGWSGVTDVILGPDGRHISRGRLRLNTFYRMDGSIVRSIWCHEAGHFLGLGHRGTTGTTRDDSDSCMSYHPAAPRHPDTHDVDQVNCQTHAEGNESGCLGGNDESDPGCLLGIVCFGAEEPAHDAGAVDLTDVTVIRQPNGETLIRFTIPAPPGARPAAPSTRPFVAKTIGPSTAPFSLAFRCVW